MSPKLPPRPRLCAASASVREREREPGTPPRRNPRARGSSRLSGSPLEPLTRGMTKTSNQLKTHKIEMFCGNTRKIERSRLIRMCTCTIEQDEVFKLPTAANFHCEKNPKYSLSDRKLCH